MAFLQKYLPFSLNGPGSTQKSLAVRKAAASFRSFSGTENKIKLAYTMLTLPQWERHSAHCPKLPKHMKMSVHAMDELPCYMDNNVSDDDDDGNGDNDDNNDRDKDGLPCYLGISTSIGTSADHPFEKRCQRSRESYYSFHGERESDDYSLRREPMVSHGYIKPSKPVDEVNRTTTSRVQRAVVSHGDDLFRREEDSLPQHADTLDPSHLIVSPLHSNKERPTTSSSNTLFPCGKDLFECVTISNLTQWKQLSSPGTTVNCGFSCDNTPRSPECNIIDLSTPS